jgi:hypothetical protein
VVCLVFGRRQATSVQKNVELDLATDTRQKLGEKLLKAIRWDKTRSGL